MARWVAVVVAALAVSGCVAPDRAERASTSDGGSSGGGAGSSEDTTSAELVDADAIIERATMYATELTQVNMAPEPSVHGDAAEVNYFSAAENLQLFLSIDPTQSDQTVSFIEGAVFVKEHLDNGGDVVGFTVMYKGPPGYNPDARDWFFARVNQGTVTHQGNVAFCVDCHKTVDNTDYIYGVALDNRR